MEWNRRRDLEGGKELGIWIGSDDRELYVEDLTYRGTATPSISAPPRQSGTRSSPPNTGRRPSRKPRKSPETTESRGDT